MGAAERWPLFVPPPKYRHIPLVCAIIIVKTFRIGGSVMDNLDMLLTEYRLGEEIGGKYFSYMYSTMNFTFVFYGATLAIFRDLFIDPQSSLLFVLIITYLLPIITYVLGLFYAYNAVAISRQGYFMILIEQDILHLCKRENYQYPLHGWNIWAKRVPSGFLLPYGTMLMFYIVLPIAMLIFSVVVIDYYALSSLLRFILFVALIPACLLTVYLIFMIYLIVHMLYLRAQYMETLAKFEQENYVSAARDNSESPSPLN